MTIEISTATSTMIFKLPDRCAELDLHEILPVRRPITRSKRTGRGKVSDVRHECTQKAESTNEFNGLRLIVALAPYDRCVVQPFILKFKINGKFRKYIPDFLLLNGTERIVVEVKPDRYAAKPINKARFRLIRALLAEHGYKFVLWRRSEIMQEPRLSNVGLMLKYRRTPMSENDCESAISAFVDTQTMTFNELSLRSGVCLQVLCRLVLEGKLFVDWFSPIGEEPVVSAAPIGKQVWPSPQADLPNNLDGESAEDCNLPALDEHAVTLANDLIATMSLNSAGEPSRKQFAWWHSRTRKTFHAQRGA